MMYFDIYSKMMNSLHFYTVHLRSPGLRVDIKSDPNDNDYDDAKNDHAECPPYFAFVAEYPPLTNSFLYY